MFYKGKTIKGYQLQSKDGAIGKVEEFYFDDHHWTIRYLVANTGGWLSGRRVLISPYALISINSDEEFIAINLTKKQIEDCPDLSADKPVSRQYERVYFDYYGWPMYWSGQYMWGTYSSYPYIVRDQNKWLKPEADEPEMDSHLRSTVDVSGHHIQATDGEIGHVEDFIIDDETWAIRYLVIDTTNWLPGGKVLVSPRWIKQVSWDEKSVFINLNREAIKQSPKYSAELLLTRDYEAELHRHYQSNGYWTDELVR